jgi:hypothetical protein
MVSHLSGCACRIRGGCVEEVQSDGVLIDIIGEWIPMLGFKGTEQRGYSTCLRQRRHVGSVESSRTVGVLEGIIETGGATL